ncbi:hypothetical protein GCM10017044_09640 [Kordiimonas sediminis]|uniref:Type II secretion system protein M n=1 Tax=Kordiimonas sediminis TaxID=1735581 RepID=A0A919E5Z3_9PROT|nr:type II secretion system protein GspM [Kordiimonas sediminis]GHF17339.1 hypothetical protein GCM10017044_09640 [Kordiimonas sediminis]
MTTMTLSKREKRLIITASLMAVPVLGYLLIYRPVTEMVRLSAQEASSSAARLDRVKTYITDTKQNGQANNLSAGKSLRTIMTESSSAAGVSINRLQPGSDGGLTVWLNAVEAPKLFSWLTVLEDEYGVSAVKASVQKTQGDTTTTGSVTAQVTFGALGSAQ